MAEKNSRIELAIQKKRMIYGVDSKNFGSIEELYFALESKLTEVYTHQLTKYKRHLDKSIAKYRELLRSCFNVQHLQETEDKDIEYWLKHDLYDKDGALAFVREIGQYCRTTGDDLFVNVHKKIIFQLIPRYIMHDDPIDYSLGFSESPDTVKYPDFRNDNSDLAHPIFRHCSKIQVSENQVKMKITQKDIEYVEQIPNVSYICEPLVEKAIDLLLQIDALQNKIKKYKELMTDSLLGMEELKSKNSWNIIAIEPYWLRRGRDTYKSIEYREKFDLLMIRPGTETVNLEKIKTFETPNEFINCDDYIYTMKCHRLIVMIPESLKIDEVYKLVNYAYNYAQNINFVCENEDVANNVRRIIISSELEKRKTNQHFINGFYFVSVDPTYYDSFFINTPRNKILWHLYDFSSKYRYHRKTIYDMDLLIDEYLTQNNIQTLENDEQLIGRILDFAKQLEIEATVKSNEKTSQQIDIEDYRGIGNESISSRRLEKML